MMAVPPPLLDDGDATLFPKLTGAQIQMLSPHGQVRSVEAGEVLWQLGDSDYDVMVVLAGLVSVVAGSGPDARVVAVQRPGDLMAELNLFTGQGSEATGIVREKGSVLAIRADEFRALIGRELGFGDFVLQTLFRRRQALERLALGVRIVGSRFDPATRRLREFAIRNRLLWDWADVDDDRGRGWLTELTVNAQPPVVLLANGKVLANPTNAAFAEAVGLGFQPAGQALTFDVAVVGGGPGGLAASVYAAAGGLSTVLLDAVSLGGQAATSGRIENYLGFPAGVSGSELASRAQLQAAKFGVEILVPARAIRLSERNGFYALALEDGRELIASGVILALGVHYRRLPVPHLSDYEGRGVAYAVDVAQAELAPDDAAVVVGGANSAGQAALTLAEGDRRVFLVVRATSLGAAGMAGYLRERIAATPAIEVMLGSEIQAAAGDGRLERVTLEETRTGEHKTLETRAMVILIGAVPPTRWLSAELALDAQGFIVTGPGLGRGLGQREPWRTLGREPFLIETSRPGVFAVGDVRSGSTKMVAPAAGEGGMAVKFLGEHLARNHTETPASRPGPEGLDRAAVV